MKLIFGEFNPNRLFVSSEQYFVWMNDSCGDKLAQLPEWPMQFFKMAYINDKNGWGHFFIWHRPIGRGVLL